MSFPRGQISIWNISLPIGLEDSGSHTLRTMNLLWFIYFVMLIFHFGIGSTFVYLHWSMNIYIYQIYALGFLGGSVRPKGSSFLLPKISEAPNSKLFWPERWSQQTIYNQVNVLLVEIWMFRKIVVPPNHPFLIGFSIIFTIHFGVPLFLGNTHINLVNPWCWKKTSAGI